MVENNELSEREREILCLVATGASNKEIAQQLYISANTVKVHLRNIFAKIGAASRTEAAMYAVQNGWVPAATAVVENADEGGGESTPSDLKESVERAKYATRGRSWLLAGVAVIILAVVGVVAWFYWSGRLASSSLPMPEGLSDWQAKSPMLTPRQGLAAVGYEDMIYSIGGEDEDGVLDRVDRYNPRTDEWQSLEDKPTAVSEIRAGVIGGNIYVPGGKLAGGQISDLLEIYSPREDRWQKGAALPEARSAYALAVFEGKLYLFGGWDGSSFRNEVFVYDPGQDAWEARTAMPTARAYAGAAVSGGQIYVLGGKNERGPLRVNEIYLPVLDVSQEKPWIKGVNLPEPRYGLGVASVSEFVFVVGGMGANQQSLNSLQLLNEQQIWQPFKPPYPVAVTDFGMAATNSFLYILGGRVGDKFQDGQLIYQVVYTVSIPLLPGNAENNP